MATATIRWKASARATNPATVLSTGLDALANNAGALSAAESNDAAAELDLYADAELVVTFGTAPTENSLVELYIVRTVDGTNYEDNGTEGRPADGYVGGFILDNVTTAQRIMLRGIRLPPRDFKIYALNKSGQAFPASGSTIKLYYYTEQAVE